MPVAKSDVRSLQTSDDVVLLRQIVRGWAVEMGFSLVDQTKLITAASELARNAVDYAGGGVARIETVYEAGRAGIRLTFVDEGPGINDVELALQDGYTTGRGLGLGLGGARRLVNDFRIESTPGTGTRVMITKWKS